MNRIQVFFEQRLVGTIDIDKGGPGFTYDPAKDSFKGWLLTVTRWRILCWVSARRVLRWVWARPETSRQR